MFFMGFERIIEHKIFLLVLRIHFSTFLHIPHHVYHHTVFNIFPCDFGHVFLSKNQVSGEIWIITDQVKKPPKRPENIFFPNAEKNLIWFSVNGYGADKEIQFILLTMFLFLSLGRHHKYVSHKTLIFPLRYSRTKSRRVLHTPHISALFWDVISSFFSPRLTKEWFGVLGGGEGGHPTASSWDPTPASSQPRNLSLPPMGPPWVTNRGVGGHPPRFFSSHPPAFSRRRLNLLPHGGYPQRPWSHGPLEAVPTPPRAANFFN